MNIRLEILLFVTIHLLKKETNYERVQLNCMDSKIKTHSGSMKSKVINMHKEKTKELKENK